MPSTHPRMWERASTVGRFLPELTPAVRRSVELDLPNEYVRILTDSGVRDYSVGDALRDYRVWLLGRFGALVSSIAAMPFAEEQRRLHEDVLLPCHMSAMLDHDCLSVLERLSDGPAVGHDERA